MMPKKIDPSLNFEDIPFHLDLIENDVVFISSDIKRLALHYKNQKKSTNIDAFIDNMQRVLSNGTLIFPAYTDNLKDGDTFDVKKSKPTTGSFSNKVFKRKDFDRTDDVLHSVFVWGKDRDLVLSKKDNSTFGKNSIFAYLNDVNAKLIFIDVHLINSFTYVHYEEENFKVSYRKYYKLNLFRIDEHNNSNRLEVNFHTRKPGVLTFLDDLSTCFEEKGIFNQFEIAGIPINILATKESSQEIKLWLKNKKYFYKFSWKEYFKVYLKKILKR